MKQNTINDVEIAFANKGYTLITKDYVNKNTKLEVIDEEGYKYHLSYASIASYNKNGNSRFASYNKFTIYNIKQYIKNHNLTCKLISSEFKSVNRDKLQFKCECNNIYEVTLNHFIRAKQYKCKKCKKKDAGISLSLSNTEIEMRLINTKYRLLDGYIHTRNSIFVEDDLGYRYKKSIYNTSSTLPSKIFAHNSPFIEHNINQYIKNNGLKFKLIEMRDNGRHIFGCSTCDNTYEGTIEQVLQGIKHRCNKCAKSQSNISLLVEQYLIDKNIAYIKEKRFEDCRHKRALPFDFYLTQYNICIEVNGAFHYYENTMSPQTLEERQMLDKIKEDYCVEHNIGFLAIPFWHIYNSGQEKQVYKKNDR